MSLKSEIISYLDKDGLVTPAINVDSTNGVMYTSEYIIALIRNCEATDDDKSNYIAKMMQCMPKPGLLQRNQQNDGGQEGPDDYLALAAALDEIGTNSSRGCASLVARYALQHFGFMNNVNPGSFSWAAFLVRQLQLDAVTLWAAGYLVGPFLRIFCAILILCSNRGSVSGTTPWRLTWLMVQVASRHSWLCRMASKVWYKRLYGVWGPTGMKAVNSVYFQPTHPLSKYVIDRSK